MLSYIRIPGIIICLAITSPWTAFADQREADPFRPFPDQLAPSLFNEVQDKAFGGVLDDEKALYYYVLKHLRDTSLEDQKQAAAFNLQQRRSEIKLFREHPERELPIFPDLFKNSDRYKGRLVTLTGRVRKLIHYPAADDNQYGMKTLYEAWLFTDDSQQNPTVVICTEVPPALKNGLPEGTDVIDHVTVTGYLFKMYVYNAQDTSRVAPLILAKQLEWNPRTTDERGSRLFSQILAGTLIVLIAGVAIAMWKASQRDKQFRERRLQKNPDQVDFNQLEKPTEKTQPEKITPDTKTSESKPQDDSGT
ncbi:hypothetical protein [Gimesia algae]|uniref:Uncharacterized protein n=1 Tax=Gimesia algae TaxID=2527971 RepID=A0A517VKC3_9PLAN|nr:hypothetical protein [Gimesia algae]QDT93427.1 hypothetical protein Pan161_51060 [Gimesia algae]